jgi:hypothetical protein
MYAASAAQKRKIYKLARDFGMDDDLLHSYVFNLVHREHIRDLTVNEAVRVIDGLSGKDVRSSAPKTDGMSWAQKRYLVSLAKQLGWVHEDGSVDEERLTGFCRSQFRVLYWTNLTRSKACKAIEAMKAMAERERGGVRA